ncbi:MAG: Holliday junction branch migration DNA helicase RuvB [Halobacteriovoraceae bacterium]|nr:Holliday junction branch migration DNA helicase RuvB [Halobacteriovoraceae bacterium]
MFQEREFLKTTTNENEEVVQEERLRPRDFGEFVGQENIVRNVEIMIESSKVRGVAADHMLLSGPPGLGKTSLAHLIANEVGSNLSVVSGPALEKKGDLAAILTNLKPKDVLFIDEIHRMHISIEEILYSAMEDYRLDLVIGQGPSARTMQIDVAPFTLIGATTRSGLLSRPLRDRFLASFHYDFYSEEELAKIITVNAKKLDISMKKEAASLMSRCSRGTPRISNRVLRRVRDFSIVNNKKLISEVEVNDSLKLMEIDSVGLDRMDRKILKTINEFYGGGPVGIESLCATLNEDRGTLEDVYEPYLLKIGFLKRTPRGREITQQAIDHLG